MTFPVKLSRESASEIRAHASSGLTQRKIAGLYGISQALVSRIVAGISWPDRQIRTAEDRLAEMSIPEPNSGCILWLGRVGARGYASFYFNGRGAVAHRVAYELKHGPIPPGLVLDHLCRVPTCINPAHLEAVTPGENILRGMSPPAKEARKVVCKRGHAFDYTIRRKYKNERICRACSRLRSAAWSARKVAGV